MHIHKIHEDMKFVYIHLSLQIWNLLHISHLMYIIILLHNVYFILWYLIIDIDNIYNIRLYVIIHHP